MIKANLIVANAAELVSINDGASTSAKRGHALSDLHIVTDGAMAAEDGRIVWVGRSSDITSQVKLMPNGTEIDARSRVVTPGLVDSHTHPVFAAPRQMEFAMRAAGKTYQQIAAEGGGIANSVAKTSVATEDDLFRNAIVVADRMLDFGTTTAEAKSWYGLTLADELKMLRVIRRVNETHVIDWIPTAMPGHEIPIEYRARPDDYVEMTCSEILPAIAREKLARFNDVFFESCVFNREQSRQIHSCQK